VRALAAAALLLFSCKESGPSSAQLAAQRKAEKQELCDAERPMLQRKWEQLAALAKQVKALPPLEKDEAPKRAVKLRQLHLGEEASATTDANLLADFDGPKRGIIGSCLHRLEECRADDDGLRAALERCGSIDSVLLIRPIELDAAKPTDVEGKFKGGFMRGEAFVFSLAEPPEQLAALTFETRLTEPVEVYRDSTTAQMEHALEEGLRRSALRVIETRLNH